MSSDDPRKVLKHLDEELRTVLVAERLVDGGEPYVVALSARQARAIRECLKAYTQASETTLWDLIKKVTGWDE